MKDQYYQKKSTICDNGPHHFLLLLQSKSTHINIFQKLSNGHQVDQTIDFLSSNGLLKRCTKRRLDTRCGGLHLTRGYDQW